MSTGREITAEPVFVHFESLPGEMPESDDQSTAADFVDSDASDTLLSVYSPQPLSGQENSENSPDLAAGIEDLLDDIGSQPSLYNSIYIGEEVILAPSSHGFNVLYDHALGAISDAQTSGYLYLGLENPVFMSRAYGSLTQVLEPGWIYLHRWPDQVGTRVIQVTDSAKNQITFVFDVKSKKLIVLRVSALDYHFEKKTSGNSIWPHNDYDDQGGGSPVLVNRVFAGGTDDFDRLGEVPGINKGDLYDRRLKRKADVIEGVEPVKPLYNYLYLLDLGL